MKKVLSVVLLLALCIGCFAGCAPKEDAALNAAKEYLYTMYKDAEEKTAVDYTVVSQVRIDDATYPITWTTDVSEDKVKITAGENNMTVVDINEATAEQIDYNLTATLKNADGLEVSVSFKHFVPKADGLPATLADGTYVILSGNLTMSSLTQDKNYGYPVGNEVTVTDGAVSGHVAADVLTIKNVDGGFTIQDAYGRYFYLQGTYNSFNVSAEAPAEGHIFSILTKDGKYLIQNNLDKKTLAYSTSYTSWGCYPELTDDHNSAVDIIAAAGGAEETPGYDPTGKTADEIIDAAYALESGKAMSAEATLTGIISAVDTPWDDGYQNITVTIKCQGKEDKPIMCFRMKGDGAKDLKVGDTITCTGIIKNYNGTIEFDAGCKVSNIVAAQTGGSSSGSSSSGSSSSGSSSSGSSSSGSSSSGSSSSGSSSSGSSSSGSSSSGSSSSDSFATATTTSNSVTFDFSSLTKKGSEIAAEDALSVFNGANSNTGLTGVTLTKVYDGNGTGGAFPNTPGLLKLGTSKVNGQMVLTFNKKVAKVEMVCHGWKTGTDNISINGSAEQQLPNTGTASTLTLNLDTPVETVTVDINQRAFIFKIIVTFA